MVSFLVRIGRLLLGEAGARILTGGGLALASYAALSTVVTAMLNQAVSAFANLPANIAGAVLASGCGEALSIVGAAMLTRVALQSSMLGLTRTNT